MRCPACAKALANVATGGWACHGCGGTWLDYAACEVLLPRPELDLQTVAIKAAVLNTGLTKRVCPLCEESMQGLRIPES